MKQTIRESGIIAAVLGGIAVWIVLVLALVALFEFLQAPPEEAPKPEAPPCNALCIPPGPYDPFQHAPSSSYNPYI